MQHAQVWHPACIIGTQGQVICDPSKQPAQQQTVARERFSDLTSSFVCPMDQKLRPTCSTTCPLLIQSGGCDHLPQGDRRLGVCEMCVRGCCQQLHHSQRVLG